MITFPAFLLTRTAGVCWIVSPQSQQFSVSDVGSFIHASSDTSRVIKLAVLRRVCCEILNFPVPFFFYV